MPVTRLNIELTPVSPCEVLSHQTTPCVSQLVSPIYVFPIVADYTTVSMTHQITLVAGIQYVPSHTTVIQQYYHSLPSTEDGVLNYSPERDICDVPTTSTKHRRTRMVCGRENSGPVRQFATIDFKF